MKKISSKFVLLIQGFIYGMFNMIPFFRNDFFKSMTHIKTKDGDLKNEFCYNYSFYIGIAFGLIFFFAFPLWYLKENYLYTLGYVFLPVIILNLIGSIIYALINKASWLEILLNLIISSIVAICIHFINLGDIMSLNNYGGYSLIALMMAVITFISLYSKLNLSSFIVFLSFYYQLYTKLNKFALLQEIKSNIGFVIIFLIGIFLGYMVYTLLKQKTKDKGYGYSSIPFYILALILDILLIKGHSPISDVIDSKIAISILLSTSIIASTMITFVMVFVGVYPSIKNRKENNSEISNNNEVICD